MVELNKILTEGDVDSKFIPHLMKKLGYKNNDIYFKERFSFVQGSKKTTKEVDALIKLLGEIMFIIESKSPKNNLTEDNLKQADFYAFSLGAKYSLLTNSKRLILRGYDRHNKKKTIIDEKINDNSYEKVISILEDYIGINNVKRNSSFKIGLTKDIQSIERDFSIDLKKIHNIIRKRDKLDPNDSFSELSKLLFIKISEEHLNIKNRYTYSSFIEAKEKDMAKIYIEKIFSDAIIKFPKIFDNTEHINLSDNSIIEAIKILEKYDIFKLPIDIKGRAFESFLSSTLRGKGLGQFFTPRELVHFIIKSTKLKCDDIVLDLACGTGGFLIFAFNNMVELINKTPKNIITNKKKQIEHIRNNNFFGVDAEPKASRIAKMNMSIWGDGENVFRGNGLSNNSFNHVKYPFIDKKVDLILMNPPFGMDEDDNEILKLYNMSSYTKKTQSLFLERAIDLLRKNGRISMVIPNSILTSSENKLLRERIAKELNIKAIVSLPKFAFKVSGADVSTSIIFLDKETHKKDYVLLFDAEDIGYDAAGRSTRTKNYETDLDKISKMMKKNSFLNHELGIKINKKDFVKEKRWDPAFFILKKKLDNIGKKWVPLSTWINATSKSITPANDDPNGKYSILVVSNEKGIHVDPKKNYLDGVDIDIKYKIVKNKTISFNPYRVNVGSIGMVIDNQDTSQKYNFKCISYI